MKNIYIFVALYCLTLSLAQAQKLRSVLFNPPGTDNGFEYVEIQGVAGAALTNVWLLEIDGDAPDQGKINTAKNLTGQTIGSNGLFLIRDAATALVPASSAGTTTYVSDFLPDLQNGTTTFILVFGFTGMVGDDIDSDNDGTPNATLPWTSVTDAVGVKDAIAATTDQTYTTFAGVMGTSLPDIAGGSADGMALFNGTWYAIDVTGTAATAPVPSSSNPGPYYVELAWNANGTLNTALSSNGTTNTVLSPGDTKNPLPVQLVSFKAEAMQTEVVLSWQTTNEVQNSGFEIERSTNAIAFEKIGKVTGQGDSDSYHSYNFQDLLPLMGINYYRLKQIDFDGKFEYSRIVAVRYDGSGLFRIYPNPVEDKITIEIPKDTKAVSLEFFDIQGRSIEKHNEKYESDVSNFKSGQYFLRVITSDGLMFNKVFIKR